MFRALEDKLKEWKEDPFRMPILLRGARQIGKSYLIEHFGEHYFESFVSVNFEASPEYISCFDSFNPDLILQKIELISGKLITPGKTLLFLDEIQNCPRAITALRYFKEKKSLLHVIGAGSLLEFTLEEEDFSFPVGRVQFIYMRPLSFFEFLLAQNTLHLPNLLTTMSLKTPFDETVHNILMQQIKQYFLVGGMPAPINVFLKTKSFLKSKEMQAIIWQTYKNDFGKYAKKEMHKYLRIVYERAPNLIGQQFKYTKIDSEAQSKDLKKALTLLKWAGLLHQVHATTAVGLPLKFHQNEHRFKILFLDIGLIQQVNQIDPEKIWSEDLAQLNAGMMAEQFVGQELLSYGEHYEERDLFFWDREKSGSEAEVDYVLAVGSNIFPIEVKAGSTGRLRSIRIFMEEKKSPFGIRISQNPLSFQNGILSIPFYLIKEIPRLVKEALTT